MISLELAKALKAAKLEWEPQLHDKYLTAYCFKVPTAVIFNPEKCKWEGTEVWLPRLDQLLQEIERRGQLWQIVYEGEILKYQIRVYPKDYVTCWQMHGFPGDTPEEAAAQALLFILNNGRKENE